MKKSLFYEDPIELTLSNIRQEKEKMKRLTLDCFNINQDLRNLEQLVQEIQIEIIDAQQPGLYEEVN